MNNAIINLKSILKNFKKDPPNALLQSYPLNNSKEGSFILIIILALLTGISNILNQKYLPITIANYIDKHLFNSGGYIGSEFANNYSPDILKYFILGIFLFLLVLLICATITYAVRTSFFKTKENFISIVKATSIIFIPVITVLLLSNILVIFSLEIYIIFFFLSIMTFLVYFYQHLCNMAVEYSNKACFICSISLIVIMFVIGKININTDIINALTSIFQNIFKGFVGL
jgi:hypothetical protein